MTEQADFVGRRVGVDELSVTQDSEGEAGWCRSRAKMVATAMPSPSRPLTGVAHHECVLVSLPPRSGLARSLGGGKGRGYAMTQPRGETRSPPHAYIKLESSQTVHTRDIAYIYIYLYVYLYVYVLKVIWTKKK